MPWNMLMSLYHNEDSEKNLQSIMYISDCRHFSNKFQCMLKPVNCAQCGYAFSSDQCILCITVTLLKYLQTVSLPLEFCKCRISVVSLWACVCIAHLTVELMYRKNLTLHWRLLKLTKGSKIYFPLKMRSEFRRFHRPTSSDSNLSWMFPQMI